MLINIAPRYEKGRGLEQNTDKPLKGISLQPNKVMLLQKKS